MNLPLSIIIPTLNEAAVLPGLLKALRKQQDVDVQIVVADGDSDDGSARIARRAGAVAVETSAGRGRQMNVGAARAQHDQLLFLHADSEIEDPRLLQNALAQWQRTVTDRGHRRVAGHFALRFRRSRPHPAPLFSFLEAKSALNRPYTTHGDQGLLLHRSFFDELGGFDERLAFLEDQRIAREIRRRGEWVTLPGSLWTSARRFEREGPWRRYVSMALIMACFAAEADEFFELLPDVYEPQSDTSRLDVLEHLRALDMVLAGMSGSELKAAARDVGALVCGNAWQLALLTDLVREDERHRALQTFDRFIAPLLRSEPAALVAGAGAFASVLGGLRAALEVHRKLEPRLRPLHNHERTKSFRTNSR